MSHTPSMISRPFFPHTKVTSLPKSLASCWWFWHQIGGMRPEFRELVWKEIFWVCTLYPSQKMPVKETSQQKSQSRWVVSNIFYFSPRNLGEDFEFEDHILQMGWFNHQPFIHHPSFQHFAIPPSRLLRLGKQANFPGSGARDQKHFSGPVGWWELGKGRCDLKKTPNHQGILTRWWIFKLQMFFIFIPIWRNDSQID